MAQTHDGVSIDRSAGGIRGLGALCLLGGGGLIAVGVMGMAPLLLACPGSIGVLFGILFLAVSPGVKRVRVTHSKLLVEDEVPVWTLLIGPVKSRVPYADYAGAEVSGGALNVKSKSGEVMSVGQGSTDAELEELKRKLEAAVERYQQDA